MVLIQIINFEELLFILKFSLVVFMITVLVWKILNIRDILYANFLTA